MTHIFHGKFNKIFNPKSLSSHKHYLWLSPLSLWLSDLILDHFFLFLFCLFHLLFSLCLSLSYFFRTNKFKILKCPLKIVQTMPCVHQAHYFVNNLLNKQQQPKQQRIEYTKTCAKIRTIT